MKKDALLSEYITKCNVYGTTDGFACNSSSPYNVTVRCKNKNLFIMSNQGGESVRPFYSSDTYTYGGITYTKNPDGSITANGTSTTDQNKIRYAASNLPPGYMYHISGCPSGGSETTYFINTTASRAGGDMGEGYDLDKTSATTFSSAYYYICIKKDAVLDNVVFKPQLEVGTVATEYVEGQESLVTATIGSTTLGESDYVDIVNKVRYTNGAASNITVDGELKLYENGYIIVAPKTSATPSKVEVSYYKDINKVIDTTNNAINNIHAIKSGTGANSEIFNDYTNNEATAQYSHAEGNGTIAAGENQHVQGKFNIEDTANKYAHIVGNGPSDTNRSNAHTLDWNGNAWYQGTIECTGIILTAPNGTKYKITVDNSGTLIATTQNE